MPSAFLQFEVCTMLSSDEEEVFIIAALCEEAEKKIRREESVGYIIYVKNVKLRVNSILFYDISNNNSYLETKPTSFSSSSDILYVFQETKY